jgi:hypothetical protein
MEYHSKSGAVNAIATATSPHHQNNGRRPYGSYRFSIERRAVVAAGLAETNGWPTRQTAGLLCVSRTYVDLVRRLDEDKRVKLDRGELKLAQVHKEHLQRLAERRVERLAAEREAKVQAEREEQDRAIDAVLDHVGIDRLMERIVCRFGFEAPLEELDFLSRRTSRDFVEIIIATLGSERAMRALDPLPAPHSVAAK